MAGPVIRITATLLTAALVTGAGLAAATPAQALPGLQRTAAMSATDTTSPKSVTATCPRGTRAIDGGATIAGGGDARVRITGLVPAGGGFTATATAGTAGYRAPWTLTAYAICAYTPKGYSGSSGHDAPGLSTQWYRSFGGGCPIGKRLIGFGAEALDGNGAPATGVALQILLPREDLQHFVAQAYRIDADYTQPWVLWGYSVCADPLPGQVRVVGGSEQPGGSVAKATCPEGTNVHAIGGVVNAVPGEVALTGVYPSSDLTSTLTFAEEIAGGASATWQPLAFAICAE